jgi:hypothetical protein
MFEAIVCFKIVGWLHDVFSEELLVVVPRCLIESCSTNVFAPTMIVEP